MNILNLIITVVSNVVKILALQEYLIIALNIFIFIAFILPYVSIFYKDYNTINTIYLLKFTTFTLKVT